MKLSEFVANHEPDDGTVLAAPTSAEWRLFIRDDRHAGEWEVPAEHRWFDAYDPGAGPNTLGHWLDDASAVYALGDRLAGFDR